MIMLRRIAVAMVALITAGSFALAQQNVTVIGPAATPGNLPEFNSTTVIKDSGIAASSIIDTAPEIWLATGQSNFAVQRSFSWTPPANAHVWNNSIGNCISTGTAFTALDSTTITPEDAFIADRALHFPNKQIYLIRVAYQGQAIAQWLPGAVDNCPTPATLQDMYTKSVNNVVPALAAVSLTQLTGILWWQGETDGINGSTTWITNFESVVTRYKGNSWYPSSANNIPNWIVFGIAGRIQNTTFATADAFNQTYILPAVNNDPFYRMFVNTAAFPATFWDTTIIPGHMTGQGYYEAGTMASRALYMNVPDGYIFFSGNTTGGALNGSPVGLQAQNAFSTLNNNIAAPQAPLAGTIAHWIQRDSSSNGAIQTVDDYGSGIGFTILGRYAAGTLGSPTAAGSGIITLQLAGEGWDGSSYNPHSRMKFTTLNTQSGTDHSGSIVFGTTPSGSTTIADVLTIKPNGTIAFSPDTNGIAGSTSGNDAATGVVGEIVTATAGAQAMSSGVITPLLAQTLGAGAWEVICQNVSIFTDPTTTAQIVAVGASTSNSAFGNDLNSFNFGANSTITPDNGGTTGFTINSPSTHFTFSSPTTVYCDGLLTYGVSTASSARSRLKAVRIH